MKAQVPSLADIPRHELIRVALDLGIERPERLPREELHRQVRAASVEAKPALLDTSSKGLFAVARNLLASVVERGLNLPDAARAIRDTVRPSPRHRPPLPTVTLAQIYLAQGYAERAKRTLEQVLERDPDNYKALELYEKLQPPKQAGAERSSDLETPASADESLATRDGAEKDVDAERGAPSARTSVTPGIAPASQLWAPSQPVTGGPRDALVLLECGADRTLETVHLYWEFGVATRARLAHDGDPVEIRLVFYAPNGGEPRRLVLPVRGPLGRADVEVVPGEVVRACLRDGTSRVLAVGLNVRVPSEADSEPVDVFRPRARAFYDDVVQRARRGEALE